MEALEQKIPTCLERNFVVFRQFGCHIFELFEKNVIQEFFVGNNNL